MSIFQSRETCRAVGGSVLANRAAARVPSLGEGECSQWEVGFLASQRGPVWTDKSDEAARGYARPTWVCCCPYLWGRGIYSASGPSQNVNGVCLENSSCLIGDLEIIVFVGNLYLVGL